MDLTIRDLMVIAGVLLILAVALDAARRIHSERYSRARVKPDAIEDEIAPDNGHEDEQLFWPRELPNGPARVVSRGDASRAAADGRDPGGRGAAGAAGERGGSRSTSRPATEFNGAARRVSRSSGGDIGRAPERPGATEDDVELVTGMTAGDDSRPTPRSRSGETVKSPGRSRAAGGSGSKKSLSGGEAASSAPKNVSVDQGATDSTAASSETVTGEDLPPQNLDWLDDLAGEENRARRARGDGTGDAGKLPRGVEPEVFMLNVVSRSPEGFSGEDILHILLACDLRFGDMDFFHRHENEAGRGAIQFSVANMMQPGVFNLDTMADFSTPGLVFFVTLPGPQDMMKAFDYMLETARAVARNLDGDVLDESRSVVTRQTLEHCRQKIRDLERRMLARASH